MFRNLIQVTGIVLVVFISLIRTHTSAFACFIPPKELFGKHKELILNTPRIIYAVAKSKENINHSEESGINKMTGSIFSRIKYAYYTFDVLLVLKGKASENLILKGRTSFFGAPNITFYDHSSKDFWDKKEGRLSIEACSRTKHPEFILGKRYLLFLEGPDDVKKYEQVNTESDKWFQFVKKNLNK